MKYLQAFDNEKIIADFSKEEKEQLFDDIMGLYFKRNFGTVSKSDLETYLFSFYLEHLVENNNNTDDYTLGRDLGLTISRVRSLKERKELKYPSQKDNWQDLFLTYAGNARFDDVHHLIKFCIPEVNVIKEVRYYFEKNNQYDEIQLNPKLFTCRPDAFVEMCKQIAAEKNQSFELKTIDGQKLEQYLNETVPSSTIKQAVQKIIKGSVEDGIKELLNNASKEIILDILSCINPGAGIAAKLLEILVKALSN